jgi:hypothetical protein
MHISIYGGLILVLAVGSFAAPTKTSNGCGYAVRKFQAIVSAYIDCDAYFRHAMKVTQISSMFI